MSFLRQTSFLAIRNQARLFSTSPVARKSVVDSAKDVLKAVDRTVSDAAVKSIETGGKFFIFD